jgi:quercetin dioxygenase-like cupin family protein
MNAERALMPIEIFDYRRDIKNVFISPNVRGRFLRMEPGEIGPRHSHDVGEELFLILEGECEFEIEGERAVLGPGQLCYTRVNQLHEVRVVGDEPMTMFLTVTPHIEPTHTFWDDDGKKLPPVYGPATRLERAEQAQPSEPIADIAMSFLAATQELAAASESIANSQTSIVETLCSTLDRDSAASKDVLDQAWAELSGLYAPLKRMESTWNALATRIADLQSATE